MKRIFVAFTFLVLSFTHSQHDRNHETAFFEVLGASIDQIQEVNSRLDDAKDALHNYFELKNINADQLESKIKQYAILYRQLKKKYLPNQRRGNVIIGNGNNIHGVGNDVKGNDYDVNGNINSMVDGDSSSEREVRGSGWFRIGSYDILKKQINSIHLDPLQVIKKV